jgi:hypothetical protein
MFWLPFLHILCATEFGILQCSLLFRIPAFFQYKMFDIFLLFFFLRLFCWFYLADFKFFYSFSSTGSTGLTQSQCLAAVDESTFWHKNADMSSTLNPTQIQYIKFMCQKFPLGEMHRNSSQPSRRNVSANPTKWRPQIQGLRSSNILTVFT